MENKLSIVDLPIAGNKVLMRVDFNVPLDKQGKITDDTRIVASIPSIQYVLDHGGAIILMSHLGRPKGVEEGLSLKPCAERLAQLLGRTVLMAPDSVGPVVEEMVARLQPGQVLLLENLRYHRGEEKPDLEPDFVKQLARLGDVYVNDAFGTAHRKHASTALLAEYFPDKAAAGFLMEKEIHFIGKALLMPKRPFIAIIGGAKVSTKLGVIHSLLKQVDKLLIGGGMAYTFYKAQGIEIGDSLYEEEMLGEAKSILAYAKEHPGKLLLPVDNVIADEFDASANTRVVDVVEGIPAGWQGVDIGPKTVELFSAAVKDVATLFWNGPLGVFEMAPFAKGTLALAHVMAETDAITVVGGGDSVAAVQHANLGGLITHISTGGGATLEYIQYGSLPGIDALTTI
jgi:phosphoglycerate kinase